MLPRWRRRIHGSRCSIELFSDVTGRGCLALDERFGIRRQGRHLVWIQRTHKPWRDEHHQLCLLRTLRLALEKRADDRQVPEDWNGGRIVLRHVIEKARD